jgi:predicted dehydrogenase
VTQRVTNIGILGAADIAVPAIIDPVRKRGGDIQITVAARKFDRAMHFAIKHGLDTFHVSSSYDHLLADPSIDAVYIPLPNSMHAKWALLALQAGKHVLCEKPFTAHENEARLLMSAASKRKLTIMEAMHWRYHPLVAELHSRIERGDIGRLRCIVANVRFRKLNPLDSRYKASLDGGALMDAGCYAVSMLREFGDSIATVVQANATWTRSSVDKITCASLRFDGNVYGTFSAELSRIKRDRVVLNLIGDDGRITVTNPLHPYREHTVVARHGREQITWTRCGGPTTYDYQLEAFLNAVRDRELVVNDAIANTVILDTIREVAAR